VPPLIESHENATQLRGIFAGTYEFVNEEFAGDRELTRPLIKICLKLP
jgi:hypothetical protein